MSLRIRGIVSKFNKSKNNRLLQGLIKSGPKGFPEGKDRMKMEKIWRRVPSPGNEKGLAQSLNISPKIASLLIQRDIHTYQDAFLFFRPQMEALYDPFRMKGMKKSIDRIHRSITKGEKILFYGDYDVDGTTSVSLMYRYFLPIYSRIQYYLPDREKEGYGVSLKGIEWAHKEGIDLIISLDCGIKSSSEISRARELGMDFIICDHHLPDEELPEAYSILNPKQRDCPYPFKFLSGCGIAFKLIQAYTQSYPGSGIDPSDLLDLVSLSIACDMVEVQDENRILALHGLIKLNSRPLKGIHALLKTCKKPMAIASDKTPSLTSEPETKKLSGSEENKAEIRFQEILFQLGPRINAAGRMGDAHRVVELLTTENTFLAETISQDLDQENVKRREAEKKITQEALSMIQEENLEDKFTNVLFHPEWHKGLVGIVASRVIEKHFAPTIILTESQGKIVGSARSVGDFNIYEAIHDCGYLLIQYGGHSAAAGLRMEKENLEPFKYEFEKVVRNKLGGMVLKPILQYHEELDIEEISSSFLKILDQFAPFGPGNPVPVFLSKKVSLQSFRKLNSTHLKVEIKRNRDVLEGIGFGLGHLSEEIGPEIPVDIYYHLDWNTFRGNTRIQLIIKDIKPQKTLWQN
jgi:single-stranded-DNA-specific exonuclease